MRDAAEEEQLLRPYLPRLLINWLAESPQDLHRTVDGSIAFVDISGFTKLSERLARLGKVGSEELTDAIGTCFARLLGVAYGNGGGLIKFGGDALLLLFTGPDHPLRACRAAVGMRRALREIGAISLGGRARQRCACRSACTAEPSTSSSSGDSHRELIITGPAASETVLMESTARGGGDRRQPRHRAPCFRAVVRRSRKATGCPAPQGAGRPVVLAARSPTVRVPPSGSSDASLRRIREQVLAGRSTSPSTSASTIAFLHFDGTDDADRRRGADAAAARARRSSSATCRTRRTGTASASSAPTSTATAARSSSPPAPRPRRATTRSGCLLTLREIVDRPSALARARRREPRRGLRRRHRPAVPADVHGHGRRGEPRRAADGQGEAGTRSSTVPPCWSDPGRASKRWRSSRSW